VSLAPGNLKVELAALGHQVNPDVVGDDGST
jgi:hypothetical protein